ncbi:MAG: hypothetical protein IKM66_00085 [Clostridia bacterium]|nr:hypothetical protein [Clostridia bacterium]
MDAIKEWALMLCTVSVGSAFVVFLIPDGNLKKSANIVITLFLLSIMILPVFGKDSFDVEIPDLSIDDFPDENDYSQNYNDFFITSSELVIIQQIEDILIEICSDNFSVNPTVYTDTNGNIVLSDIHIFVFTSDSDKVNIIKNKVGRLTGIVPEVTVENGNSEVY